MKLEEMARWTTSGNQTSGADISIKGVENDGKKYAEIIFRNGKAKMFRSNKISFLPIVCLLLMRDDECGTKLSQVSPLTNRTRTSDPDVYEWAKKNAGDYNLRYSAKEEVFYINATRINELE